MLGAEYRDIGFNRREKAYDILKNFQLVEYTGTLETSLKISSL